MSSLQYICHHLLKKEKPERLNSTTIIRRTSTYQEIGPWLMNSSPLFIWLCPCTCAYICLQSLCLCFAGLPGVVIRTNRKCMTLYPVFMGDLCECVFLSVIGEEVYNKKETHVPNNEQTFAKNPHSIFQQQTVCVILFWTDWNDFLRINLAIFLRVEIIFIHLVIVSCSWVCCMYWCMHVLLECTGWKSTVLLGFWHLLNMNH